MHVKKRLLLILLSALVSISLTSISGNPAYALAANCQPAARLHAAASCCGNWSLVSTPSDRASDSSGLAAVSALSPRSVWAVGYASNTSTQAPGIQPLIEHWDGTAWQIVSSPTIAGAWSSTLNGIAALADNNIWTVGGSSFTATLTTRQLIEHWNGARWSMITPPALQGSQFNELYGIAALSANNIWAVGGYTDPQAQSSQFHHALIEHWNGLQWSIIPAPKLSSAADSIYEELQAIAALSSNDIWAVGIYLTSQYASRSLIEHWDGRRWAIVPGNDQLTSFKSNRTLNGLAALSQRDIWAVGRAEDVGPIHSLIKHWDGKRWQDMPGPVGNNKNRIPDGGDLRGIVALSANDIWAVGAVGGDTRIEHWNGSTWSIVASPSLAPATGMLRAIASVPGARELWAVGNEGARALTELYCAMHG